MNCCEKNRRPARIGCGSWTIQCKLGRRKCLVIVGVRLSAWRRKRGLLQHEDLVLLRLTPMKQSTAVAVAEELEATRRQKSVVIAAVLSDEGAELKSGMALFRERCPQARRVPHVFDIKHKVAILLKKELHHDATWQSFVTQSNCEVADDADGTGLPCSAGLEEQGALHEPRHVGGLGTPRVGVSGRSTGRGPGKNGPPETATQIGLAPRLSSGVGHVG